MVITIERETLRRIKGFTKLAVGEVGGMARVKKGNPLFIHDLRLIPQLTSGTSVNIEQENIVNFLTSVNNPEEFKFLWHSHASMDVFLSKTDEDCIDILLKTSPFLINCVSNKSDKTLIRFDGFIDGIRLREYCTFEVADNYEDLKEELHNNLLSQSLPENTCWEKSFNLFSQYRKGSFPYSDVDKIVHKNLKDFWSFYDEELD